MRINPAKIWSADAATPFGIFSIAIEANEKPLQSDFRRLAAAELKCHLGMITMREIKSATRSDLNQLQALANCTYGPKNKTWAWMGRTPTRNPSSGAKQRARGTRAWHLHNENLTPKGDLHAGALLGAAEARALFGMHKADLSQAEKDDYYGIARSITYANRRDHKDILKYATAHRPRLPNPADPWIRFTDARTGYLQWEGPFSKWKVGNERDVVAAVRKMKIGSVAVFGQSDQIEKLAARGGRVKNPADTFADLPTGAFFRFNFPKDDGSVYAKVSHDGCTMIYPPAKSGEFRNQNWPVKPSAPCKVVEIGRSKKSPWIDK